MANYMSRFGNEDNLIQQVTTAPVSPKTLQWVKSFLKNGVYFLQMPVLLYEFELTREFCVLSDPVNFEIDGKQLQYHLGFEMPTVDNLYSSIILTVSGLKNTIIRLKFEIEFWIKNKDGTKIGGNKKLVDIFDRDNDISGFADFLHYDELFSLKKGLSKDDYFTVYCQIKKRRTPKLSENNLSEHFFGFKPGNAIDRLIIALSNEKDSALKPIVIDYIVDCISFKDFRQMLKKSQNWKDFKKKNRTSAKKVKKEIFREYEN